MYWVVFKFTFKWHHIQKYKAKLKFFDVHETNNWLNFLVWGPTAIY